MKKIGIIDYEVGNLFSLKNALEYLNINFIISRSEKELANCSHLILPGVGAFLPAISSLKKYKMDRFLKKSSLDEVPIMGICLGMQLFFNSSNEFGIHHGLSLIQGKVKKINNKINKIPIIGWHKIKTNKNNFLNSINNKFVYLLHSYECIPDDKNDIIGIYKINNQKIVCAVRKKNIIGVQFHPEKSDFDGIEIFKQFISL